MFLDKRNIYEHRIILPYLIKTNLCKNVKFQPCLEPSIESINNVPTFYRKMIKNEKIICPCSLTYLQLFFPSFYGLSLILKLTIKIFLFLVLRIKISILLVRFFITMARLNHGIALNLKIILTENWIILEKSLHSINRCFTKTIERS